MLLSRHLLSLALVVAAGIEAAQPAHRIKDLEPGGGNVRPYALTVADGRLFFIADDGPHGTELWTSDGTAGGTTRVPGSSGLFSVFPGPSGAYFIKDAAGAGELWKSDGTPAGTSLLKSGVGWPMESATIGAVTFFSNGRLWRTDGTGAGTFQLFGNDGLEPVGVQELVSCGSLLCFFAAGLPASETLWWSDGTAAGTSSAKPPPAVILPSYTSKRPMLSVMGNRAFFGAFEVAHGSEPWISDGPSSGATLFQDLEPGAGSSSPQQFTRAGSRLFFPAYKPGLGWRLWSTDGIPSNTTVVDSLVSGGFANLTAVGGRVAFRDLSFPVVWASDGTNAGTVKLRDGDAASLTDAGSRLFFTVNFGQLWTSDLTPAGTRLVKRFGNTLPSSLTAFGGLLYFVADDGIYGPQLWKSDGTAAGTVLVAVVHPGPASSVPQFFQELNGAVFFIAANGLWRSDGTEGGTTQLVGGLMIDGSLLAANRKLFWVESGFTPVLMMNDGTAGGTAPVPVPAGLYPQWSTVAAGDRVLFFGRQNNGDLSLWRADGSTAGSVLLGVFTAGRFGPLVPFRDAVVFLVDVPGSGAELWRSDGTPGGTSRVKLLGPSACLAPPRRVGRSLVFLAGDGGGGCALWSSDGTTAGTVSAGLVSGQVGGQMTPIGSARGVFAFTNFTDLWRTDGTAPGTFLLKSFSPAALPAASGAGTRDGIFFAVQTNGFPDVTQQLWKTDGSVLGTVLLHDFKANGEDARISSLTTANGRLLMTVSEGVLPTAQSLWTSDGTPQGTFPVQQNAGAVGPGFPYRGVTFFAGTDPWAGTELWAMDGTAFTASVRATTLSLLTPCRVLDTRLANGFLGGPAVPANAPRVFPVGDVCGIPWTARAIAANVTITGATSDGLLRVHASDIGAPDATVMNFRGGQTRANNATIGLGADGEFTVRYETTTGAGEVQVIVDVVGFYE